MLPVFFSGTSPISLNALLQDRMCIHKYFIDNILSDFVNEKSRIWRRNQAGRFFVHFDNSANHNTRTIIEKILMGGLYAFPTNFIL
jgi:hypothetical protein